MRSWKVKSPLHNVVKLLALACLHLTACLQFVLSLK
jgi:hypothetical protein